MISIVKGKTEISLTTKSIQTTPFASVLASISEGMEVKEKDRKGQNIESVERVRS
jgi:hypothetical protein